MFLKRSSIFVLMFVFWDVYCELSTKEHLEIYKSYIKTSVELEKHDRVIMNIWMEEMQVNQVNITSSYRLQMTRHNNYYFRRRPNHKWQNCMEIYEIEIKKPEKIFYKNERECLIVSNSADQEKKLAVSQFEKEIKKWRKTYRYLANLCHTNHPDDKDEAGLCLVEYMQRDNYNMAVQRLLSLKLEAMGDLYRAMSKATSDLEKCIKTHFSRYLENIRSVMEILNKCYGLKTTINNIS